MTQDSRHAHSLAESALERFAAGSVLGPNFPSLALEPPGGAEAAEDAVPAAPTAITTETVIHGRETPLAAALIATAGRPWALRSESMEALVEAANDAYSGPFTFNDESGEDGEGLDVPGGVAVIPLKGIITPAPSFMSMLFGGGGGLAEFKRSLLGAVENEKVRRIVLDVDSPGGVVDLVPETAALIRQAREVKPITAVASTQAASAAYWLAAQADEVVVTPSGEVGSVGVYMMHTDMSEALGDRGLKITLTYAGEYKTEGNQYEPLSDGARRDRQAKVDEIYNMFVADVADGRRVSRTVVRDRFGKGRTVLAHDAVEAGMADRVATLDEVLAEGSGGGEDMLAARPVGSERRRRLALLEL